MGSLQRTKREAREGGMRGVDGGRAPREGKKGGGKRVSGRESVKQREAAYNTCPVLRTVGR